MKRTLTVLAALLIAAVMSSPAFAQPSPVDEVGGVVVVTPAPVAPAPAPAAPSVTPVRAAPAAAPAAVTVAAPARAGLPDTGLELTTGTALAGALILGGGFLVLLARKRAAASA